MVLMVSLIITECCPSTVLNTEALGITVYGVNPCVTECVETTKLGELYEENGSLFELRCPKLIMPTR